MATDIETQKEKLRQAAESIKKELQVAIKEDSAAIGKMAMIGGAALISLVVVRKLFKSNKKKKHRKQLIEAVHEGPEIIPNNSIAKKRNPFVRNILEQIGIMAIGLAKQRILDYLDARKIVDK